jgi:dipeptidyl aminopeptidase/acylaminoacyl peptidase
MPKIAPYGTWEESKITADSVTAKNAGLNGVKVSPANGGIYLWETRPNGSNTIYEIASEGNAKEIVPEEFNVRSTVHEYGGAAWNFTPSGKIVFANFADQDVYLLEPDTKAAKRILQSPVCRFADFDIHPLEENLILAIQEDHTHDDPSTVVNSLVLINSDTGNVKELVQGADFYTTPRFSPDGKSFTWLQWSHPEM